MAITATAPLRDSGKRCPGIGCPPSRSIVSRPGQIRYWGAPRCHQHVHRGTGRRLAPRTPSARCPSLPGAPRHSQIALHPLQQAVTNPVGSRRPLSVVSARALAARRIASYRPGAQHHPPIAGHPVSGVAESRTLLQCRVPSTTGCPLLPGAPRCQLSGCPSLPSDLVPSAAFSHPSMMPTSAVSTFPIIP